MLYIFQLNDYKLMAFLSGVYRQSSLLVTEKILLLRPRRDPRVSIEKSKGKSALGLSPLSE